MDADMEVWKPVVGFEGRYEVSSWGRIRSLPRIEVYSRIDCYSGRVIAVRRKHKGKLLSPGRQGSGHLSLPLGKTRTQLVHTLVLTAFCCPRPEGMECLHGDGNPANNRINNLRWGTRSENIFDAIRHGARDYTKFKRNERRLPDDLHSAVVKDKGSILSIAKKFGISWGAAKRAKEQGPIKNETDCA